MQTAVSGGVVVVSKILKVIRCGTVGHKLTNPKSGIAECTCCGGKWRVS